MVIEGLLSQEPPLPPSQSPSWNPSTLPPHLSRVSPFPSPGKVSPLPGLPLPLAGLRRHPRWPGRAFPWGPLRPPHRPQTRPGPARERDRQGHRRGGCGPGCSPSTGGDHAHPRKIQATGGEPPKAPGRGGEKAAGGRGGRAPARGSAGTGTASESPRGGGRGRRGAARRAAVQHARSAGRARGCTPTSQGRGPASEAGPCG